MKQTLIEKQAERAVALLSTPHPKHPGRNYTVMEASAKTGVSRATIYRYKSRLKDQSK